LTAGLLAFPQPAEAFQVKRVLRNTTAFQLLNGEEVKTYDLTSQLGGVPLDMTKCFIVASTFPSSGFNTQTDAFIAIDDPSTIMAARRTGTAQVDIQFMVIEFVDGVSVQSGLTVISETALTKNIVLPASVDLAKSFALITWRSFNHNTQATHDDKNLYSADLTAVNNLRLQRSDQAGTFLNDVYYQVVSFDEDVTVTKGTVDIDAVQDAGETSDNGTAMVATINPALTSVNDAMMFFTIRPSAAVNGVDQQYKVDGYINATNAITFTRNNNTNSVSIVYYLLNFSNEMYVQHARNTATLPNGTASGTFNLPTVTTLARTFGTFSSSGPGTAGNADNPSLYVTGALASVAGPQTQVTLARSGTSGATAVSYMAPELPPVNVTAPDTASIIWKVGEARTITWKHADDVAANTAAIDLSVNGGSAWLGTSITCDEGARTMASDVCTWTIPDSLGGTSVIGNNLRIRVRDTVLAARNFDPTDVSFEIIGSITVTAPNGSEVWYVGDTNRNITWTNTGNHTTDKVNIYLSENGGSTYPTAIVTGGSAPTVESGTYAWNPMPDKIGTDRRVRVESQNDPAPIDVFDTSNANFEIRGSVTVTYPNGAETLETQKAYNITWNKTGTFAPNNEVNIYYSKNSGGQYPTTLVTNQAAGASSGSYSWTPVAGDVSDFARVKVTQRDNSNVTDESNADFLVKPSIVVSYPNGGENLVVGTPTNVTWTTNGAGLANVKIEYSINGGGAYSPIIENDNIADDGIVTNNGTRSWDVPDVIGGNVLIKISNPSISAINDVSDAIFRVKGQTKVLIPNGTELWPVGGSRNIQWSNVGTFTSNVDIRFSTNGGADGYPGGNTIVAGHTNTGASGSYTWNPVVDIAGGYNNAMRIKVLPVDSVNVAEDTSDASFTIHGTLTLAAPNGGQTWVYGGAAQNITWTKTGAIGNVELRYSTNSGGGFGSPFATGLNPTAGTPYAWTLPDSLSNAARIQVRTVDQPLVIYDDSDADFFLKGSLTVTAPNTAVTWYRGDIQNVTWTRAGTTGAMTGNVDIHYTPDNGSNYYAISVNNVLASAGTYPWTIPTDAPNDTVQSDTVKVRVRLSSDTVVSDESNVTFKIKPRLTLTAPNTNVAWIVGTSQNITWTTAGSVPKVKLSYSTTGGSPYANSIVADLSNVNSYAWTIPDAIGTQLRVLVAKDTPVDPDSAVEDFSDADFEIKGSLTLTSPNLGTEVWIVGSSQNITWTKTGSLTGNVKLYYSTDGGSTYVGDPASPFATVAVTAGSYAWTIPDAIDNDLKVKVVYVNDTAVADASNAVFTVKGSLTITAPNTGTEIWDVNTLHNITWTKTGTIGNVDLSLSLDGGTDGYATSIVTGVTSTSPYAWTIPSNTTLTVQARVKIAPVTAAQAAADTSDANFRLRGSFTLTAPSGPENWIVGASQNITWTSLGGIANAKLEYSRDSGSDGYPYLITASTPAGAGSYAWTVGWAAADADKTNSSTIRVRVSDAATADVNDTSDADFTIRGSLALTAPNGGENWLVGSSQNIAWTRTGKIPNVKLVYSVDSGVDGYPESTPNQTIVGSTSGEALSYAWTIPDKIGTALRVKIYDLSSVSATPDTSNADFTIRGSLAVTAPNGSESWTYGGAAQNVTWTLNGTVTGNVKLYYSNNGGSSYMGDPGTPFATVAASAGTYAWTIPDDLTTQARVKITHAGSPTADPDESNANFTIKGVLVLVAPNGGEDWRADESQNITWTRTGTIALVNLYYSTNSGGTYPVTIASAVNGGNLSRAWTIPNTLSVTTARVKIEDNGNTAVLDTSDADFIIKPKLTLLTPNGSEVWYVNNNTDDITWTTNGTVAEVNLKYATDGSTFSNPIATQLANINAYDNWVIPDALSTTVKVRVESFTDAANVSDVSNADFTIRGAITVTAPNTNVTWIVGDSQNVTWTKVGSLTGNVNLYYSTNGGSSYLGDPGTPFATPTVASGSYALTIPDAIGSNLKVKAVLANNTSVTDESNTAFTVKGSLIISAPNGGEVWDVNTLNNITWTKTGTIGNVDLSLSLDGGTDAYATSIVTGISATSPYAWTIPSNTTLTAQARVKIAPVTAAQAAADTSDANFRLRGSFTLTAPNGGEPWIVGAANNVTWTLLGGMVNAKLEYTRDGGSTYHTIVASTAAGSGSYAWTVDWANSDNSKQVLNSNTMRVRISDAADVTVQDSSNANFTVKGSLTLAAPNGGENWLVGGAQNITWTRTGYLPNVKLEYSTDGGSTYPNEIVASTSGEALSYAWTIPNAIDNDLRVQVTDLSAVAAAADVSNANFTIRGALTLTSPNGGEQLGIAGSHNITWTRTGTVTENVKLVYSTDGGSTYPEPSKVIVSDVVAATQTYAWTVPDAPTIQARVKIIHTPVATPLADPDESNANFSIKGTLTIVAPNGAETWKSGESRNITWTRGGSIASVRLSYSKDSGATFPTQIIASTAGADLAYGWTVPDVVTAADRTKIRVKIEDVGDPTVSDTSNADFTIRPQLTLTAPNGGQTWLVGASQNITWTKNGSIPNVKLVYSTDSGSTYPEAAPDNTITGSTPGADLSFAWTVPDKVGTLLRVKIVQTDDAAVVDTSDGDFAIKGSLALTSPNGGETWLVNESRAVTWTRVGTTGTMAGNVELAYSINGGTGYGAAFATPLASALTYAWTVPDAIGTQLRVRVRAEGDTSVSDESNANFTIKGILALTAPNGGQTWGVGTTPNITWTRTGSITNVKLDYSVDSGGSFPNAIIASTDASTGTYAWTVPAGAVLSTQARVRVTDAADAAVADDSNADFNLVGVLVLTAPNGGEIWAYNTSQNVTWTRSGNISNVKLEYSTNGGSSYPNVIIGSTAAATQSYTWTVPNEHSATVRVKVSDAAAAFTGIVSDTSNANFKIRSGLTLSAPDGGEVWTVGSAQSVGWGSSGTVNNVMLEYSTNGGSSYDFLVTNSAPNTGSYSWTVPDAIGTSVRVKITDAEDAAASDASNGNFKIRGSLTLGAPNGGEQWGIATSKNVTWTRNGSIANVKLDYSLNGGTDYDGSIVASTAAAAGTYAWTIPDFPTATARVKVADAADALLVFDTSNANFSIKGSVNVTAPNGGETWIVGADNNVTWTKFGSISSVEIRYSENNGSTWPAGNIIVGSTSAAAGTYTWTIPDKIGNSVLVRITDTADTSTLDDSNAVFSIKGSYALTSPNGSETWVVGESRNITWTKTGTLGNAKLEMSVNGGSVYPTEIVNPVASVDGTYGWTVPDAIGTQVRVKITLLSDTAVNDASSGNFTIKGSLTLNAPNGGEVWTVGSNQPITWSRVGSIANVKLVYSTDGGVSYPEVGPDNTIVASTAAAAGSYSWTIPDAITTTARVKAIDFSDASVSDTSNANFKIAGSLALTAPNGGEAWLIGGSQNITWTKQGAIANVKLEYSTNSGGAYPNEIIASTSAAAGTYAWTIPDAPSTAVRVKITNTSDSTVNDASNADFNIRGTLTVVAPNGSEVWTVGESRNITWSKTGSISNVELRYSTNSGSSYPTVIVASTAASALSYAWTVPDAISTTARVKITDTTDSAVTDTSNADFKIRGALLVTAPNGGETWIVGAAQNITWTRTGSIANVKLDYATDGGIGYTNPITASTAGAAGTYAWTIPDAIGNQVRVRIGDAADDNNVYDMSDNNLTIKGAVTLNAPNGAESWIVGASQNITWSKSGTLGNCKLEYSTTSGAAYPNEIVNPIACATLTYAWTIPDAISAGVRVKLTNLVDTGVSDASNADFNIKGSLTLTSPNGSETWLVGETRSITWTKTGSIATARLDYSTNGGVAYPNVITASTGAGGLSFLWTVPDNMSTNVKVRIRNVDDTTVEDESNASFKIAGSFTLNSPNGAEKWPAGSLQSLTWSKTGSIANAKLELSTDGGSTYPTLIVATTPASNLSYAWTLGSATSTQCRVKITDVSDSGVNDATNANFKIMGGFSLTAPNGGEVWVVGSSQNITWTTSGTVANVKLDYSTDGGASYPNVITASVTNTGSYGWTIPDAIGTTLRVKVEDVLDIDAKDESDANFKIKGSVTVTAPNGGELWDVGASQNITWTKTGTIANVKIEFSTDGGTNYPGGGQVIANSFNAGAFSYSWTVPDYIYTTLRVRLTDVGDATVVDQSNNNFTVRGAFTLTAPNGGEKWKVGATQVISWTTFGTIPNVKLEYSSNGGTDYSNIAASAANTGTYNWTLPNAISTTAKVRVSNAADAGTLDVSNANFKIMGNFTVTAPDGGEVLTAGSSYNVTWTNQGTVSNVELKYSTNSGGAYGNTIVGSASNTGTYSWTVPDAISSTLRVRVADATDATDAFDTSNADFKIRAGFTLTAPNGSEAWTVGTARNVTWTTAGTVANVKLEYSINGGTDYVNIIGSTANSSPYSWTIPDAITTAGRVRVSDVNDSTANDASNANFKIQGVLTMTAPNGGEKWTVNSARSVSWDRVGSIANVKLDFSTNGGSIYAPIIASTANTGTYAWTIPDSVSTDCLVKVTDTNDATVTDASNAAFKIQAGFVVTAPNGGEVWGIGSARTIAWTTNGTVAFVKIDYSTDGGTNYTNQITTSTANTGTYNWTIPDAISGTVRVKVSQTTDAEAFDTSDGNFRIRISVALVAPNGAEVWRVGQSRNVTWSISGTIPNVKLQYSRDGFNADLQTINISAPQTGSYAWTIPDAISNTVRVRVSDPNDIGALDDSNADFRIIANFTVTAPNGSEQWTVGSAQTVTWTSAGSVSNVKLEYSTNSGGSWNPLLGSTPNDGTQGWTVPDAISANARLRVSDPADSTSDDTSDNDFKIRAFFALSAPNGSEIWTVNESRNITWTNTGTVPNVKLEYSTDGGANYNQTIAASTGNTGTYAWTVPDAISTTVRVKVTSTTDVDGNDASDANFKIRGAFNLTAPNGAENWKIANNHTITWTTTGTMANVKLSYSTNGGAAFPNTIIASVANTNSYVWNVADAPTTAGRVRVESVLDNTVYDDSNANFNIQGNFTLTLPNGGESWSVGENRNITWNWGGTIPNVKLTYSTDSGSTFPSVITASAPNGPGSSGSFSYAWTVPNSITTTARVKVEDVTDGAVFDASNADFKIQGKLTLIAPNGSDRWVVNETKPIQWSTAGSINNVKLEYSTDSGSTYPNTIVASVANGGSYNWVVPNTTSTTARVRVLNVADNTVADASDTDFTIDLYQITVHIKDLLTNNALDQVGVDGANSLNAAYLWQQSGITSPITKGLQYGTWPIKFSRVEYGDQVINVVADRDQTMNVYMETQVVHLWEVVTEMAYNSTTDTVAIAATLRRDGSTVIGVTSNTVKFYDGGALIKTFTTNGAPDAQGFYNYTWTTPTGLVAGKVYNVVSSGTIATGGVFNTPKTFSITEVSKLQDVQNTINDKLNMSMSTMQTNIRGDLSAQTGTITGALTAQTSAINTSLSNFETKSDVQINALKLRADEIKDAGGELQKSSEDLNATNAKFSGNLITPKNALINDKDVKIQYRAIPNLVPLITITAQDTSNQSVTVVSGEPMSLVDGYADMYEYTIDKITSPPYTPGKAVSVVVEAEVFTYVLDAAKGKVKNVEAGSFIVESTTLSTLEGLVASQGGLKDLVQSMVATMNGLKGNVASRGDSMAMLDALNRKIDQLPRLIVQEMNRGSTMTDMKDEIAQISETLQDLAGKDLGLDLTNIVGKAIDESSGIKELRQSADRVQGSTELMQKIVEQKWGGIDAPVIHAIYQ
jgi:sarcosine oxidase gamma subunit